MRYEAVTFTFKSKKFPGQKQEFEGEVPQVESSEDAEKLFGSEENVNAALNNYLKQRAVGSLRSQAFNFDKSSATSWDSVVDFITERVPALKSYNPGDIRSGPSRKKQHELIDSLKANPDAVKSMGADELREFLASLTGMSL